MRARIQWKLPDFPAASSEMPTDAPGHPTAAPQLDRAGKLRFTFDAYGFAKVESEQEFWDNLATEPTKEIPLPVHRKAAYPNYHPEMPTLP